MAQNPAVDIAGYQFSNPQLLRQALTHRSHSANHNERLEFLGDAVLNCIIAAELYRNYPALAEGELSRVRASLVNGQSLSALAIDLGLGARLLLGEGELRSGGAARPSILADALEAICGAVFLDGGWEAARDLVARLLESRIQALDALRVHKDAKTTLQEILQGQRLGLPEYRVVSVEGQAHDQAFCVECAVPALGLTAQGAGTSRRRAEQEAAAALCGMLRQDWKPT